jgi:hypothetical protein
MGLMFHGFEREMQRQRAAAMGSLLLGSIQQSPEAAAAATAASASTPYRALAPPPLIRDPNATASAVVPKKRTDAAASSSSPAPTVELSRGFSATPLNPFVDPTRLPTVTPDVSRFIQNVMTAARQMPTAPPRPPGQDLLITYLQKKHQEQLALPSQPQKRRPAELQGRPAAKQKTDGQEQEQAKEATSGASSSRETPGIRTKGKVQEVHVVGKKLTSTNYNAWEALTPLQLEEQLTKYYGYKHKWDLKNASRYKNQMLEFAVKTVPLRKGKSTPQDS